MLRFGVGPCLCGDRRRASTALDHLVVPDAAAAANANFQGDWQASYDDDPGTSAELRIDDEDLATGDFSGTVVPPEGRGALSEDFDIEDGHVTGDQFHFTIEHDGIGAQDSTYTADWTGTIDGDSVTGNIEATLDPLPVQCQGGDGGRQAPAGHGNCLYGGDFERDTRYGRALWAGGRAVPGFQRLRVVRRRPCGRH